MEFVYLLILIIFNALLIIAESAILVSSQSKGDKLLKNEDKSIIRKLITLIDRPEKVFSTIQICSSIIVSFISVFTFYIIFKRLFPVLAAIHYLNHHTAISLVIILSVFLSASVIIVLGNLVPRALGRMYSDKLSIVFTLPVIWLSYILKPLNKIYTVIAKLPFFLFKKNHNPAVNFSDDLLDKASIEKRWNSNLLSTYENELLNSVYEFSDIDVRDVMIPKPKIYSIQINTPAEAVLKYVVESGFSRYPVYRESLDDTVGVLYDKDLLGLLEKKKSFTLKEIIRPVHFVYEKKKLATS